MLGIGAVVNKRRQGEATGGKITGSMAPSTKGVQKEKCKI
jgi:hypothetical protein